MILWECHHGQFEQHTLWIEYSPDSISHLVWILKKIKKYSNIVLRTSNSNQKLIARHDMIQFRCPHI